MSLGVLIWSDGFQAWLDSSGLHRLADAIDEDSGREPPQVTKDLALTDPASTRRLDRLPQHDRWVLALGTPHCLFQPLPSLPEGSRPDRAEQLFELEAHLPLDAEAMAADFQSDPRGVSAIAVDVSEIAPVLTVLRDQSLSIVSVVPWTMLLARASFEVVKPGLVNSRQTEGNDHAVQKQALWIQNDDGAEWVLREDARITAWHWCPVDDASQVIEDHDWIAGAEVHAVTLDSDANSSTPDWVSSLGVTPTWHRIDQLAPSILEAAKRHAAGQRGRWFELLRDALEPTDALWRVRGPAITLAISAAVLLASSVGALTWRAQRIEKEMRDLRSQQRQLVESAYPGKRIPASTLRWVRSEYARQTGTRSVGSRDPSLEEELPVSAVARIDQILRSLPRDVRFQIQSLDIDRNLCDLIVRVAKPTDAGRLVTAMDQSGWTVSPPVTTQVDSDVFESRIEATFEESKKPDGNEDASP